MCGGGGGGLGGISARVGVSSEVTNSSWRPKPFTLTEIQNIMQVK